MSNLTVKQKAFVDAFREALIERHENRGVSHYLFNTTVHFSLEGVGMDFGTPEYDEAYEALLFHPDLRLREFIGPSASSSIPTASAAKKKPGFVYILKNDSFPDLLKIGYTTQDRIETRVKQLSSSTGVPTPFEVAYFVKTEAPKELEAMVHEYLDRFRLQPKEFFNCDLGVAIAACNQCKQNMRGEA